MKPSLSHTQLTMFSVNRYHRTTKMRSEKVLRHRERKANAQETIILFFMRERCMESFSAPQVFRILSPKHPEIRREGSVRRALSNLASEKRGGMLIMTEETEPGDFGHENHKYQYSGKPSSTK